LNAANTRFSCDPPGHADFIERDLPLSRVFRSRSSARISLHVKNALMTTR
jgi:hypothetical protein